MRKRHIIPACALAGLFFFTGAVFPGEQNSRLSVTSSVSTHSATGKEYVQTVFNIDTGVRQYRMLYKTFHPGEAELNPRLNDGRSGYGMMLPHQYWYWNGFVDVRMSAGDERIDIRTIAGEVKPLAKSGPAVGYDLVFEGEKGAKTVIRTIALAGREELFLEVFGKAPGEDIVLSLNFRGYPFGFSTPRDRWAYTALRGIGNAGEERKQEKLLPDDGSWILLADHVMDPAADKQGLLGLAFCPERSESVSVIHNRNYPVEISASSQSAGSQRFIVYTFAAMHRRSAWELLSLQEDREQLMDKAFGFFPEPW